MDSRPIIGAFPAVAVVVLVGLPGLAHSRYYYYIIFGYAVAAVQPSAHCCESCLLADVVPCPVDASLSSSPISIGCDYKASHVTLAVLAPMFIYRQFREFNDAKGTCKSHHDRAVRGRADNPR